MRKTLLLTGFLFFTASCAHAEPVPASHPIYRLTVTAPGTRSQGVRGVLYDTAGKPRDSALQPLDDGAALAPVDNPLGHFEWVRCTNLWSVCGDQRIMPGAAKSGIDNKPMVGGITDYRVTRTATLTGSVYTGELFNLGKPVEPAGARVETPIGVLVRLDGTFMGQQWRGWIPAAWLPRERVFYEETMEAAGSKSQHTTGTFFDDQGHPDFQLSLDVVETPIGPFLSAMGGGPWSDSGMFHQREVQVGVKPGDNPDPIDVTTFRVVQVLGDTGFGFRGELLDRNAPLNPAGERVATTLGPMVRIDGAYNGHPWSGWIPLSWLPPKAP